MKTRLHVLWIMLVAVMALTACGGDDNSAAGEIAKMDTDTPDGAFMASIAAMKANDLKSLIKNSLSEEQYNELVTEFENNKTGNFSEADKAQFASAISMLTSDGAEENLYQMVEPQLEQARAMLPMMLMMGKDQVLQGLKTNPMLPESQRDSAVAVVGAAMDWAGENDILSEDKTKAAIAALVSTAKELDMTSLDDVQNMSFDQALEKGSIAFGGVKDILGAYGINMNDMLNSVEISDLEVNGDQANMNVTFELFGETVTQPMSMIKKDGVWVGDQ
jgi:major membrane immunogen (membrane-anchored lipoprotein)